MLRIPPSPASAPSLVSHPPSLPSTFPPFPLTRHDNALQHRHDVAACQQTHKHLATGAVAHHGEAVV